MTILNVRKFVLTGLLTLMFVVYAAGTAWAHGDTENGPVAKVSAFLNLIAAMLHA